MKRILDRILILLKQIFNVPVYSVSFDSTYKFNTLPKLNKVDDIAFFTLNKDLGIFEVLTISNDTYTIVETGTDNIYKLNADLFNFLFSQMPVPAEAQFH